MTDISSELGLTPQEEQREERRKLKHYQKRLVAIRRIASQWLEFERTVLSNEDYHRTINKMVAEISQKRSIENNKLQSVKNKQKIQRATYSWGTARDEILTIERVDAVARRFNFTYDQVQSHVAKVANHAKWLKDIYAKGEGGMLSDINRELEPTRYAPPIVMRPAAPETLILRAVEINRLTARANADHQRIEREFHSDDLPAPPKTQTFGFLKDVDRESSRLSAYRTGPKKRKPRKNWKKEVG
jgi:hypothetical protein